MHYFAYGSNMLAARLRARCASAVSLGPASVAGYRMAFAQASPRDGSAKATLIEDSNATAHGVLFRLDPAEGPVLDGFEGVPRLYRRLERFSVTDHHGATVEAVTYLGNLPIDPGTLPFSWYRDLCLHGAREHGLHETLIEALASHAIADDPSPDRTGGAEALRILAKLQAAAPA